MRGRMWSPGRPWKARREDRVRFWEGIAGGVSSEDAAAGAGVSAAVGSRWFRQAGGMPPISLGSVSGRYLSFTEREEIAIFCAQGVGVREIGRRLVVARRRFRGSCAATRRLVVVVWFIGQRLLSGTQSGVPAARSSPSWPPTTNFVSMWRIVWVVRSPARMVSWCQDPRCAGRVAVTEGELTGGGQRLGVLSRSRGGSGSISPTMSPCESPMKPSTRRPMCKAEAR